LHGNQKSTKKALTRYRKGAKMVEVRKTKETMENDAEVPARLLVLATSPEGRSKIGRLRTWLPVIEATLKAGVSLEVILGELNSQGLNMKFGAFKTALYRIRKEKPDQTITTMPAASPPANSTPKGAIATTAAEPKPETEEAELTSESSENLSARERREKLASQYITPESSNSLLKRLQKGNKQ
jgi:hypothetical protein